MFCSRRTPRRRDRTSSAPRSMRVPSASDCVTFVIPRRVWLARDHRRRRRIRLMKSSVCGDITVTEFEQTQTSPELSIRTTSPKIHYAIWRCFS
jgi:hypothetical protein